MTFYNLLEWNTMKDGTKDEKIENEKLQKSMLNSPINTKVENHNGSKLARQLYKSSNYIVHH